ncbi:unnamed protein product [Paramecium octaurelia]|uniref:Uncharacterized protein n=1 Tax=Paramecium octaurelia TaxID=43137 RepID=A0A8S1SR54_PAROT|nr:unnamed protein product [Paramecium octaurelia]
MIQFSYEIDRLLLKSAFNLCQENNGSISTSNRIISLKYNSMQYQVKEIKQYLKTIHQINIT